WFHQSENGFIVHPSKAALPEPPIRSPKFARIHIVQTTIGVIAVRQRAPIGIAARAQRPCGFHRVFSKTAAKMITTSGALLTLVRHAAASASPMLTAIVTVAADAVKMRVAQKKIIPPQRAEKVSLLMVKNTSCGK